MYPILLQIGSITIHSYGVAVAAAVLAGLWLAGAEARREGFARGVIDELALPVAVAGLAGGRLAYVLGWEPDLLWRDPVGLVAIWRGGLALHGALVGGIAAGAWVVWRRGLAAGRLADAVAPALILGQALGRIGCFLSGDSYGRPASVPWAVTFTDPASLAPRGVPLHPTQLYELGLDLVLLAVLWALRRRTHVAGQRFLLYLGGYGVIRLITEVFRGDRVEIGLGLSLLQGASLVLLAAALGASLVLARTAPPRTMSPLGATTPRPGARGARGG